uniref:Uncharacterized protein n=1 Tax=Rhizophagus irregularis (strain DAOM 181602 / DAOM 197198 / MUCL 43194) TaxID=747089 RepID=U9U8I8_RHIID
MIAHNLISHHLTCDSQLRDEHVYLQGRMSEVSGSNIKENQYDKPLYVEVVDIVSQMLLNFENILKQPILTLWIYFKLLYQRYTMIIDFTRETNPDNLEGSRRIVIKDLWWRSSTYKGGLESKITCGTVISNYILWFPSDKFDDYPWQSYRSPNARDFFMIPLVVSLISGETHKRKL